MTGPRNTPPAVRAISGVLMIVLVLAAVSVARGAPGDAIRDTFDTFTGEWSGDMQIKAPDGFLLKTVPVKRRYYWEGESQVVETSYSDGTTDFVTRERRHVQLDRLTSEVTRTDQFSETYTGTIVPDGILWTNTGGNRRDYDEHIAVKDGVRHLDGSSLELIRMAGVSGVVRVQYSFQQVGAPASRPGQNPSFDPGLLERNAELERKLAAAEKSLGASAELTRQRDALREQLAIEELETRRAKDRVSELEAAARHASASPAPLDALRLQLKTATDQLDEVRRAQQSAESAVAVGTTRATDAESHARRLETERADLAARLAAAEKNTAAAGDAHTATDAQLADARAELARLRPQLDAATHELQATRADRDSSAARADAARTQLAQLQQDNVTLTHRADQLATDRDALAARVAVAEKTAASSAESRDGAAADLTRLRADLAQAAATAEAGNRELERVRAERDALLRRASDAEKSAAAATEAGRSVADLRTALAQREAALAEANRQLTAARTDAAAAVSRADLATADAGRLNHERQDLLDRVQKLESNASASAAAAGDAAATRTALTSAQAELASLRLQLDTLRTQKEAAEAQFAEASRNLAAAQEKQKSADTEIASAATLRDDLRAATSRADAAEARVNTLTARAADAEKAQRDTTAQATELIELRARLSEASSARDHAQAEAAAAVRDATAVRTELTTAHTASTADGARLTQLNRDLAATQAHATELEKNVADLQQRFTQAQSDNVTLARRVDVAAADNSRLSARITELETNLADSEKKLQANHASAGDADRERATMRDQIATLGRQLDAANTALAQARSDRDGALSRASDPAAATDREKALQARITELEARAARVAGSPPVRPPPAGAPPGAGTSSSRDQMAAEVERLNRRVIELESERNAARDKYTVVQGQVDQAKSLRDDTLTRFQDVVAQLNAMRDERDRLARDNVSLQAEVRAHGGSVPEESSQPGVLDRLLGTFSGSSNSSPAKPAPAPSPARPSVPAKALSETEQIEEAVASFQVIGATHNDGGDKAILNGQVFRGGELVDPDLGITFQKIEGGSLVFSDRAGKQYRRKF